MASGEPGATMIRRHDEDETQGGDISPELLSAMLLEELRPVAEPPPPDPEAERARDDFDYYLGLAGRDDHGAPLVRDVFADVLTWSLVQLYPTKYHLNIKSPPQLGKTLSIAQWFAWIAGRDPATKVGIISGDKAAASDLCAMVRKLVLDESFKRVFPHVRPDIRRSKSSRASDGDDARDEQGWRRDGFFLISPETMAAQSPTPTFGAYAVDMVAESRSFRWLIADDIITRAIAASPALMAKTESAFYKTFLEGRLSKGGGRCVHIQNHRADGDLGDKLRSDKRFVSIFFGVTDDLERMFVRVWNRPDGKRMLFEEKLGPDVVGSTFELDAVPPKDGAEIEYEFQLPNRAGWNPKDLAARNPDVFPSLYQLKGSKPEDLLFRAWESRHMVARPDVRSLATMCGGRGLVLCAGVDISGTGRAGNAFTVMAKTQGGTRYPVAHRAFSRFEDGIDWLDGLWREGLKFERVVVENNGVQTTIVEMMKTMAKERQWEWWRRVDGHVTGRNKMHPSEGLPALASKIATGELCWPEGMSGDPEWRALETAFATMRRQDALKSETTPDRIMATWKASVGLDELSINASDGRPAVVRRERIPVG